MISENDVHIETMQWRPEECLTFDEAVRIYTIGASYAVHSEQNLGKLLPGWKADFVVLDKNIQQDPRSLTKTRVQQVWVHGHCRYNTNSKFDQPILKNAKENMFCC